MIRRGFIICVLWMSPVQAASVTLDDINAALKNLPAQSGRFEQRLPNGTSVAGTYHMDWPARLRFAYDGGGALVTVRGKFVAIQDTPRGEPNWFPVSVTPLAVIRAAAQDGISPDMVARFEQNEQIVSVALRDPSGDLPGQATLFFTRPTMTLYAWRLVDVQNLVTQVRLSAITPKTSLDDALFAITYDDEDEE